jgi:hypothetical protein
MSNVFLFVVILSVLLAVLLFFVITGNSDKDDYKPSIGFSTYDPPNNSLQNNPLPKYKSKYYKDKDQQIIDPRYPKICPQIIHPLPGNPPSPQASIQPIKINSTGYIFNPPQKLASLCNTQIYPDKNTYAVGQQAGPIYPINQPNVNYGKWNGYPCDTIYYNSAP